MGKSLDKVFKAVVNELKKNCLIWENLEINLISKRITSQRYYFNKYNDTFVYNIQLLEQNYND